MKIFSEKFLLKHSILKDSFLKDSILKDSGFVQKSDSERFHSERFRAPGLAGLVMHKYQYNIVLHIFTRGHISELNLSDTKLD
jgi:hypothetical protein